MSQEQLIDMFMQEFDVSREQAEELLGLQEQTESRELELEFQYCMSHE